MPLVPAFLGRGKRNTWVQEIETAQATNLSQENKTQGKKKKKKASIPPGQTYEKNKAGFRKMSYTKD